MKYGESPSEIIYDALVRLNLKLAAILLSGNISLNKSPILSVDLREKFPQAVLVSHKISAFRVLSQ